MFVACAYPWKLFFDSVDMESAFRTKSVSTNPYLHRTCVSEPLCSNGLFCVYSLQRARVFGEPLASSGLPLWLNYSGFRASFHNTICKSVHIILFNVCLGEWVERNFQHVRRSWWEYNINIDFWETFIIQEDKSSQQTLWDSETLNRIRHSNWKEI
jgi:hypothetical protein